MQFALQIWTRPSIAVIPMAIVLLTYAGRWRFPMSLPGGLVALLVGTGLAWALWAVGSPTTVDPAGVKQSLEHQAWHWPQWFGAEVWEIVSKPSEWAAFLSVIIPMALFNLIGSLQNIESADAAGDSYDTQSSLVVNGLSSIVAGLSEAASRRRSTSAIPAGRNSAPAPAIRRSTVWRSRCFVFPERSAW